MSNESSITNKDLNLFLMRLSRRSEKVEPSKLVQTFVDVGPLFTLLSTYDNQTIFGRRGTGKTHALLSLAEKFKKNGDFAIYIDLRNLGSTGGIYTDPSIPLSERATRLLIDVLSCIHEYLREAFIEFEETFDISVISPLLDEFAESITSVKVVGHAEQSSLISSSKTFDDESRLQVDASPGSIGANISIGAKEAQSQKDETQLKLSGEQRYNIHFGSVRRILEKITKAIHPYKVWLLLDEWSSIPLDLQPYLADLLRRSIFPIRDIITKIATIEYRSNFKIPGERGNYIGIELGADISADINLDDFMVFDNDANKAREFYKTLYYNHITVLIDESDYKGAIPNSDYLINIGFTQINAFDELVRAAEGVPRDALHIASLSAQYADDSKISIPIVRKASKNWYQNGKYTSISSQDLAILLLHWIIEQVIGGRKARAFLLKSGVQHRLIEELFDARILHVLKRNISARDHVGVRFNAYKLDYGCYVDLITTTRAPLGLFQINDDDYIEVPPDDYRSIRRAILDLEEFEKTL